MAKKYFKYEDYMMMCRVHNYFTCGGCDQYDTVAEMAHGLTVADATERNVRFEAVLWMTWICSDREKHSIEEIEANLRKYIMIECR